MTDATETVLNLDALTELAAKATGRNWRWTDHRVPDLVATVDIYDYETERYVVEADHDGGCSCRRDCTLELNVEPQDREFIAATGPDVVLTLIARIQELEAQVAI